MPTYDELVDSMIMYTDVGVEVALTELDVSVVTPGDAAIFEKQAEVYHNATAACLKVEKCVGITLWDWTDRYTWVPNLFPDLGEGLVWDVDLMKKPAYAAILSAFQTFVLGF